MATWEEFATEQPDLAGRVRERFDVRKHKTLATLRADGAPRISGIEIEFADGEINLGMMADSLKLLDLRRDPRLAVHSPTEDPPEGAEADWPGEAKIAGRAVEAGLPDAPVEQGARFAIDISEVAFTHLNDAADLLVIESWHPGRGIRSIERT
jgi:Pyridoxamine 5'-phosphate oxidase